VTVLTAADRYAHPHNAALLKLLRKQGVPGKGDVYDLEGYELHTHPDLCDRLQSLNPGCYRGLCGVPVLANDRDLLFGVARGTSLLALRLPEPDYSEAKAAGGRDDADGGAGWILVDPWTTETGTLKRWGRAAHAYANSIKD
jgi:hypothetical protein